MPFPDLNDLFFFAQVVKHGGFAAAGRALGLPKSRLSRRVADLEERLGTRLLQRTTRKLALTELGQQFLQHCQAMLAEAEAAEAVIAMHQAEPRGTVRVSCPVAIAQSLMTVVLPGFLRRYPRVRVLLQVTNRPVDLFEENVDVAIRVRAKPEDSAFLVMRSFGMALTLMMASPEFLAEYAAPTHPEQLADYPTLAMTARDNRPAWSLVHEQGEICRVELNPRLVTDEMQVLKAAALEGLGIVLLPAYLCREELADGRLLRVLPEWQPPLGNMHCVFPSRTGLSPAVRAFIDMLAEELPGVATETGLVCPERCAPAPGSPPKPQPMA